MSNLLSKMKCSQLVFVELTFHNRVPFMTLTHIMILTRKYNNNISLWFLMAERKRYNLHNVHTTRDVLGVTMYIQHTWCTGRSYTGGRGENRKQQSPDIRCGHLSCVAGRLPLSTRHLHGDKQSQKHTSHYRHYLSPNTRGTVCSSRWDTCFLPVSSLLNRNFVRDTLRMARRHPEQTSGNWTDTRFRTDEPQTVNVWESRLGHRPGHEVGRGCRPLLQLHQQSYPQLFLEREWIFNK